MIPRHASDTAQRLAQGFPIVAITGPRQSGKTTLARAVFPKHAYVSLEDPDHRTFATEDPRGFLDHFTAGLIIDEAQRCPSLFSYLQSRVDAEPHMGRYVLTGSQQLGLSAGIHQSLAGRVALIHLLPLSIAELNAAGRRPHSLDQQLFQGGYPAIYDRDLEAGTWLAQYIATYLERDVLELLRIRHLDLFGRFVRLAAARTGQLLNLSTLASDCGISHVTAREWLAVLEASYLFTRLPPFFRNFGKRLVKHPKLYCLDVGLAAWLSGIRDVDSLAVHPMRGALFETLMVSELMKTAFNQAKPNDLHFWRDHRGEEIDVVIERNGVLQAMEFKSGATVASDWFKPIKRWQALADRPTPTPILVYGGNTAQRREGVQILPWHEALMAQTTSEKP